MPVIELAELHTDEMLFSSILANALDNAVNAQDGHGNGTVSIQYATEKLGGNLQFVITH